MPPKGYSGTNIEHFHHRLAIGNELALDRLASPYARTSESMAHIHSSMSSLERSMPPTRQSAPFTTREVGHVPFQVTSLQGASHWLLTTAAPNALPVNVRLANAYNVALADADDAYRLLLRTQGVNFPDGTPVVWFMNIRHRGERASRVRGPSLFELTIRESANHDTRHFLLGGSPETLARLTEMIRQTYPDVIIAGTYSPPFTPITDQYLSDCVAQVSRSGANLVWLGLGTPKQDVLGTALASAASVTTVNVGAAFDFVAGTVREAPKWMQASGTEWLHRLATEPRRLWKRYLFGNARFLCVAVRAQMRRSREHGRRP